MQEPGRCGAQAPLGKREEEPNLPILYSVRNSFSTWTLLGWSYALWINAHMPCMSWDRWRSEGWPSDGRGREDDCAQGHLATPTRQDD
eukprot:s173_g26.t1